MNLVDAFIPAVLRRDASALRRGRWVAGIAFFAALAFLVGTAVVPWPAGGGGAVPRALAMVVAGAVAAWSVGFYDYQRREAESRGRESDQLYRWIFEQSKDVIVLATLDGRQLEVNQAGVDLYGFDSKEELLARRSTSFYPDPRERESLIERLRAEGHVEGMELHHATRDGRALVVQATVSAIRDEEGEIVRLVGILRDVTEQKRAAAEREAALAELAAANAELERFTYSVSHDLKSPLITIRGFVHLLEQDLEADDRERVAKDVAAIAEAARRMQFLVDDLLELSRLPREPSEWTELDLGELAREVVDLLAGRIRQERAEVEIDPRLPRVRGDRTLVFAALQNLVENAVKFTAGVPAPRVRIGQRPDGSGGTVFLVEDNGVGVAPEHRESIFGLFSQLDAEKGGTGIGLATVRRAVEAHGGRVWVESAGEGSGSTFCFTLAAPAGGS